jgi:metallo-beta-lactamase family protein
MLSAHADADALVEWMTSEPTTPRRTYVNHGEADASAALQELIWQQLSWQVEVPSFGTTIDTTHLSPELTKAARHG